MSDIRYEIFFLHFPQFFQSKMYRAYLLLYNVAMAAGWTSIGWAALREVMNKGDLKYVFRFDPNI